MVTVRLYYYFVLGSSLILVPYCILSGLYELEGSIYMCPLTYNNIDIEF